MVLNVQYSTLKYFVILAQMIVQAGADPENELGGGQFRGSPSVQGRSPGRGLEDEVPQKLTTFRI